MNSTIQTLFSRIRNDALIIDSNVAMHLKFVHNCVGIVIMLGISVGLECIENPVDTAFCRLSVGRFKPLKFICGRCTNSRLPQLDKADLVNNKKQRIEANEYLGNYVDA